MTARWSRGQLRRGWSAALVALLASSSGAVVDGVCGDERGGEVVVSLPAEPRTFNPLVARDAGSLAILGVLMEEPVGVHAGTSKPRPLLAEEWRASQDRRRLHFTLRREARFSDGQPVTADDVLFTFTVLLDEEVGAPQRDLLLQGGQRLDVFKVDERTVRIELQKPHAVGVRMLDSLFVLPRHRLADAYESGKLRETWALDAGTEVVGAGPFRLRSYEPGVQLVLERNPHYWRVEDGVRLPCVDRLRLRFESNPDRAVARFGAGETDFLAGLDATRFESLQRRLRSGRLAAVARDLGAGLSYDLIVFNQNSPGVGPAPARAAASEWFSSAAFRKAVNAVVDRPAIARLVYRGRAESLRVHVASTDPVWALPPDGPVTPDVASARALLASAGFAWRDNELVDVAGRRVRLSLVHSSSNPDRARIAAIIQEDLSKLGIDLVVVPLEFASLVERLFEKRDYELALLTLARGDFDPNPDVSVFASSGANHVWDRGPRDPLPPWQSEIDRLLAEQMFEADHDRRIELYRQFLSLLVEHVPVVVLTARHSLVAYSERLGGVEPGLLGHPLLWNVEEVSVDDADGVEGVDEERD